MTSSPIPGHGPWGEESWNETRPSRVPMVQIWMLSDEWLVRYTPLECLNVKLWSNSTNGTEVRMNKQTNERTNERTNIRTDGRTERRKLYTPWHKCRGINIIVKCIIFQKGGASIRGVFCIQTICFIFSLQAAPGRLLYQTI